MYLGTISSLQCTHLILLVESISKELEISNSNLSPSLSTYDANLVLANAFGIGVYNANYDTQYTSYSLSGITQPVGFPPDENFPVIVFIAAY